MTNGIAGKMAQGFDYIFYRIYAWQLSQWKNEAIAANAAGVNIGVLVGLNVLTFSNIASIAVHNSKLMFFERPDVPIILVTVIWIWIFGILYRKRSFGIIARYKDEQKEQWKKRTIYIWSYFIVTSIFFFFSIVTAGLVFQK